MDLRKNSILVLLLMLTFPFVGHSQSWDVGVLAGGSGYMGDLNPVKPYEMNHLGYGAFVRRNFDGYWSLRVDVNHGKISAADSLSDNPQQKLRNLSFFSSITELGLKLEFNFFKYIPSLSEKKISPYLFTGGGIVVFNPRTNYMDVNGKEWTVDLAPLATEGQDLGNPYRRYAISIPYGAGVKYNVAGRWTLGAELGYRTALTDYLDDVRGRYPDFSGLDPNDPQTAVRKAVSDRSVHKNTPYTQRGDFRPRDTYFFGGITITYSFLSSKCPPVR